MNKYIQLLVFVVLMFSIVANTYSLINIQNNIEMIERYRVLNSKLLERLNITIKSATSNEVFDFLIVDSTDKNEYIKDSYVCNDFSNDVVTNAMLWGIECSFVHLSYKNSTVGHAVVAFNTTDKGIIFIEPQSDDQIYIEVGKKYWGKVISNIKIRNF